jgi:hypothetical protein
MNKWVNEKFYFVECAVTMGVNFMLERLKENFRNLLQDAIFPWKVRNITKIIAAKIASLKSEVVA